MNALKTSLSVFQKAGVDLKSRDSGGHLWPRVEEFALISLCLNKIV